MWNLIQETISEVVANTIFFASLAFWTILMYLTFKRNN